MVLSCITGGECFGMTAFSQWYYSKKKTSDGDFFPRFMEVVGTEMPPNGEERDVTAQDVIATRSFAAAIQAHNKSPEKIPYQMNSDTNC